MIIASEIYHGVLAKNHQKSFITDFLSEFMLQQTQVKTVIPYFKKFTKKYKTLESLI